MLFLTILKWYKKSFEGFFTKFLIQKPRIPQTRAVSVAQNAQRGRQLHQELQKPNKKVSKPTRRTQGNVALTDGKGPFPPETPPETPPHLTHTMTPVWWKILCPLRTPGGARCLKECFKMVLKRVKSVSERDFCKKGVLEGWVLEGGFQKVFFWMKGWFRARVLFLERVFFYKKLNVSW